MSRAESTHSTAERYDIHGALVELRTQHRGLRDGFAATFGHFRCPADGRPIDLTLAVAGTADELRLDDGGGAPIHGGETTLLPALLERTAELLLNRLADAGIVAVHAGAVTDGSGALVLAGPSGRGKSTLTLALVSDGMKLLSDEFALIDRDSARILPYRRSVHVRPGTPERVPILNGLLGDGPRAYGGGIRWAVPQARLETALPGCLADPAPLRYVLVLEPPTAGAPVLHPISHGEAVVALLRGTPQIAHDVSRPLQRLAQAVSGARCARLRAGGVPATVDAIRAWMRRQ